MKPLLPAIYQPQSWIDDNPVDIDGRVEFDAASAFMSMSPEQMLFVANEILKGRHDIDDLAVGVSDHNGPFLVTVDEDDFEAFLALHGVYARYVKLTGEMLAGMKHAEPTTKMLKADFIPGVDAHTIVPEFKEMGYDDFGFFCWDRHDLNAWHAQMPEASIEEVLAGEPKSIFIKSDADGFWVSVEESYRSSSYPSLSLAMIAGDEIMVEAEKKLLPKIAEQLGIDLVDFDITIKEDMIQVSPKDDEDPTLWISSDGITLFVVEQNTNFPDLQKGIEGLKAAMAPAPSL
jgi:hypothetical protein